MSKTWVVAGLFVVSGCQENGIDDYRETIASARWSIPYAVQMEKLYGDADHFVVHYGSNQMPLEWQTVVRFGDRYELSMRVDVDIDYYNNTIVPVDDPEFILNEVVKLVELPDGRVEASFGGPANQQAFGLTEWMTVFENGGDFGKIGLSTDGPPIPKWSQYVWGWRKDRIYVSLLNDASNPN